MTFSDFSKTRLFITVLVVALAASAVVLALREAGALQVAELRLHDWMKSANAAPEVVPDVALVAIDDEAFEAWGWPLPDETLAALIRAASAGGAKVIGVDIYRDRPVGAGSADLVWAFEATDAIGIFSLGRDGKPGISAPFAPIAPDRHGFADILIDDDGVVRRALLLVADEAGLKMSFALRLALAATGRTDLAAWSEDPQVLAFGQTPVPRMADGFGPYRGLDDAGYQIPITFSHGLPVATMVSAGDLLAGRVAPDALLGKVVILGTSSDTVKDQFRVPLSRSGAGSFALGIQVHAAIVQQLIDTAKADAVVVRSPEAALQAALILAASLLGGGLVAMLRNPAAILFAGPGIALLSGLLLVAGLTRGLWLPALPVALASAGSSLGMFTALSWMEGARYRAVTRLFSDHLSPALAAEVWRNRELILKGGKPAPMRLYSTVLFADLSGSTAIGGGAEPQAFMAWVSDFLDMVSGIATRNGGFVEKFTGDGIMIVFGAPVPSLTEDDHRRDAEAACRCAAAISEATVARNKDGNSLAPYSVRIGLHSGPVFGGTIGSHGTLRYNVMGDTVNVAARVEAFGKKSPDRRKDGQMVCLTSDTAHLAVDVALLEPFGTLVHDDGQRRFEVYQLVGVKA